MKKALSLLSLLILFCGFLYKINNVPVDKSKFFIQDLNYRDFSLEKLSVVGYIGYSKLQLVDFSDEIYIEERKYCSSSEFYYYSIVDTTNYYSYVYYYFKDYVISFVLVNYDKKGNYIDDVVLSSISGDAGFFEYCEGTFVNDSTFVRIDMEGENVGDERNSVDSITNLSQYKIVLQKEGKILVDTLIYNLIFKE
ncbi:MAG TPA: hypothetical protein PLH70_05995 [Bacteroidales bacterium]|nr:hypothetical protein [Bacteroidales bacterium]HOH22629.1 hypothetical protein [Bacteroidales bacterium]HPZ03774.1 hypothetical protein [Bacteroidales bacterium]HQB75334.1 hypothetical protein [Bacteroidales bacterium]HQQ20351.1 hypothetical protein [Bacteroidales bacterium]